MRCRPRAAGRPGRVPGPAVHLTAGLGAGPGRCVIPGPFARIPSDEGGDRGEMWCKIGGMRGGRPASDHPARPDPMPTADSPRRVLATMYRGLSGYTQSHLDDPRLRASKATTYGEL